MPTIKGTHKPHKHSKMHLAEHAAVGFFDLLARLPEGTAVYLNSVFRDEGHKIHNHGSNHSKASALDINVRDEEYKAFLEWMFIDYRHLSDEELENYGDGKKHQLTLSLEAEDWLKLHNARVLDERGRDGAPHFHIDFMKPGVTETNRSYKFYGDDGTYSTYLGGSWVYGTRYKSYQEQVITENGKEINYSESEQYKNTLKVLEKSKVKHDKHGYVYDFSSKSDFQKNVLPVIKSHDSNIKSGNILPTDVQEEKITEGPVNKEKPLEFQYEIEKGDSLSKLAIKYNTTVEELMNANPHIKNKNKIYTGDILNIPGETQPGGSSPIITPGEDAKGTTSTKVNPQDIYNYLIDEHNLSHNHAMGIMANIAAESSFDSSAIGDNGSSYGLFQYNKSGGRRQNMLDFVGDDWKTDWKGQIDFIFAEDNKDSRMKQFLGKDYNSVEDSAYSFMINFERPADKSRANAVKRVNKLNNSFISESDLQEGYKNKTNETEIIKTDPIKESEELLEKIEGAENEEEVIKILEEKNKELEKRKQEKDAESLPKGAPIKLPDDARIEDGVAYWEDENGNQKIAVLNEDDEWVTYTDEELLIFDELNEEDELEDEELIIYGEDDVMEGEEEEQVPSEAKPLDVGPDVIITPKDQEKRDYLENIEDPLADDDGILEDPEFPVTKEDRQTIKDLLNRLMPSMIEGSQKLYRKFNSYDGVIDWMKGETNGVPNDLFMRYFGGDLGTFKNMHTKADVKEMLSSRGIATVENQPQMFNGPAGRYFKLQDMAFNHKAVRHVQDFSKDTVFFVPASDIDDIYDPDDMAAIFRNKDANIIAFNSIDELKNHSGGYIPDIITYNNEDLDAFIELYSGEEEAIFNTWDKVREAEGQADWEEDQFTSYDDYNKIPYANYKFSDKFKSKYFRGVPHDRDTGLAYTPEQFNSLYTSPEDVNIIVPRELQASMEQGFGRMQTPGGMITAFENLIELKEDGYIVDSTYGEITTPDGRTGLMIYPPGSYIDKYGAWVNEFGKPYYWGSNGEFKQSDKKYTYEDFIGGIDSSQDDITRGKDFMNKIRTVENGGFWDVKTTTMYSESGVFRDSFNRLRKVDDKGIEYKLSDEGVLDPTDSTGESGYWKPTNKGLRKIKELGYQYDSDQDAFYPGNYYKKNGEWFTPNGFRVQLDERNNESLYHLHMPKNIKNSETYKKSGFKWNSKEGYWKPPDAYRGADGNWYVDKTINSSFSTNYSEDERFDLVENRYNDTSKSSIYTQFQGEGYHVGNLNSAQVTISVPITKGKFQGSNVTLDWEDMGEYTYSNMEEGSILDQSYGIKYTGNSDENTYVGLLNEFDTETQRNFKLLQADTLTSKGYTWASEYSKWFEPGVTKGANGLYTDEQGFVYKQNRDYYSNDEAMWSWQHTPESMKNTGWTKTLKDYQGNDVAIDNLPADSYFPPGTYVDDGGSLRIKRGNEIDDQHDQYFFPNKNNTKAGNRSEGGSYSNAIKIKDGKIQYGYYKNEGDTDATYEDLDWVNSGDYNLRTWGVGTTKDQREWYAENGWVEADDMLSNYSGDDIRTNIFSHYGADDVRSDDPDKNYSHTIWLPPGAEKDEEGRWMDTGTGNYYVLQNFSATEGDDAIYTPTLMTEAQMNTYYENLKDSSKTSASVEGVDVGQYDPWGQAKEKITGFLTEHGDSAITALQAGVGLIGLGKALKDIPVEERPKLSGEYQAFQRLSKEMAQSGMDPKTKYAMRNELTNAYSLGIKNALRASGGSRATFLANAGVLNANRVEGLLKMGAMDSQQRLKNMEHYGKVLNFAEEFALKGKTVENNQKYEEAVRKSEVWGAMGGSIINKILGDMSHKETMKTMQPVIESGLQSMRLQFEDMFNEFESKADQFITDNMINPGGDEEVPGEEGT